MRCFLVNLSSPLHHFFALVVIFSVARARALSFVVSAKPLFDISPSKIVLKVAQD